MKTVHSVLGGFESSEGLAQAQHLGGPRDKPRLRCRVGHGLVLLLARPVSICSQVDTEHRLLCPQPSRGATRFPPVSRGLGVKGKTAGLQSWTSEDVGSGPRSARVTTEPCPSHFTSLILRFSI